MRRSECHLPGIVAALVVAAAVAAVPPVGAQTTTVDVEAGYQWVDVSGSENMYRTQVDEDDGFVINDLSLWTSDPDGTWGLFDHLRLDAAGFGGSPSGTLRLETGLADLYGLRLTYRRMDSFSALSTLANPRLADGIVPGLHTWDRDRETLDLQVELLPGNAFTPLVGYRWSRYEGPGRTTYHVGADEFRLASELEETEEEYWVGLAYRGDRFSGSIIQGWREFEGRESRVLAPGAGTGVGADDILGRDPSVDALTQRTDSDAETPVTTGYVSGWLTEDLRLRASFARADVDSEIRFDEALTGSLVSFELARFFAGLDESVSSRTENPSWRGDVEMELDLGRRFTVDVAYERRHRELEGWALVSSLYLDTLNFSGAEPRDIEQLVDVANAMERDEDRMWMRFTFRDLGPVKLWAEGAVVSQEIDIAADAAQIIVPGGQEGMYERDISSFTLGAALHAGGFKLILDLANESGDEVVVRTDFEDRSRIRLRAEAPLGQRVDLYGTAEILNADSAVTGYDTSTEHFALDLVVRPTDGLSLRGAWDTYDSDTDILIREPQDFGTTLAVHSEDGEMFEAAALWRIERFELNAGWSNFENEGSFPFEIDRVHGRVGYFFTDSLGAAVELERSEYTEEQLALSDFEADRYGVYLRWRR